MKLWTIKDYSKFVKIMNSEFNFVNKEQKDIIELVEYNDELLDLDDIINKYVIFYVIRFNANTDYGTTGIDQEFVEIKKDKLLIYGNKVIGVVWDNNTYVLYAASLDNKDFPNYSDQSDTENYICYCIKNK